VRLKNNDIFLKSVISILLIVAVLAIYRQVGDHSFIYYDDEDSILINSRLRIGFTPENIYWFLTSSHFFNWHPLTWFSHMLDVKLFGFNAMGHHYVSVALHAVNSILLFLFLHYLTGSLWRSIAVAALFAVHPLNVESVAWVSERKNVLSTMFWILTLHVYSAYTKQKNLPLYILSIVIFILGLMSKQMLVSIPLVLLLLDFWPLKRIAVQSECTQPEQVDSIKFKDLLLEKIPFLLLAIAASGIALSTQKRAMSSLSETTLAERIANASLSYVQYLRKIFWPNDLAVFYPFPESLLIWEVITSAILLIAITGAAFKLRTRYPVLFVGWFWYMITLVPVIGIVKIGLQSMADRYAYIPSIGIFVIVVWFIADLAHKSFRRKLVLSGAGSMCMLLLAVTAWKQTAYWKDTMTLFSHTLAATSERNFIALGAIGRALEKQGYLDEALQKFDEALMVAPWYEYAKIHQGMILMNRGKLDAAVFKYDEAILQNPTTVPGHINLGIIMGMQGNLDAAIKNFRIALDFDPRSAAANYNMALTLYNQGKTDEAIGYYEKALDISPTDHECHFNLGIALLQIGRKVDAIRHFREALRLKPDFNEAGNYLEHTLQMIK
jgi:Flp pilus assembly protein TadD